MMLKYFSGLLTAIYFIFILGACQKDSKPAFDILDSGASHSLEACEVASYSPKDKSVRIAHLDTATNTFSVTPNTGTCDTTFYVNDVKIDSKDALATIPSSTFQAGENKVEARLSNSKGVAVHQWTVVKNNLPSCTTQIPAASGINLTLNQTQILTANALDIDNDPLTFTWKINGVVNTGIVNPMISNNTASQAMFTPSAEQIGSNTITAEISDGLDSSTCSWTIGLNADCAVLSSDPTPGTVRVSGSASTSTTFTVNTTSPSCTVTWSLNGTELAGTGTTRSFLSSNLLPGGNVLVATVANGTMLITKTWTVVKNTAPACAQTPTTAGNTVGLGNSISLTAVATDVNNDPITFSWSLNNSPASPAVFAVLTNTNTSVGTFSPNISYYGINTIAAQLSDGYDSTTCTWTVNTLNNCAISSSQPTATTQRISNSQIGLLPFSLVPNDSSCVASWVLNGTAVPGTNYLQFIDASTLGATNTLQVTISNGVSTDTKTWTINKNNLPTCTSQTPAATGNNIGVGTPITLTANAADPDADTMSFTWDVNGTTPNASYFTYTTTATSTQGIFNPNSGFIGSNTVRAKINDGYDIASCNWNVQTLGTCSFVSSLPSTASVRVSSNDDTSTAFGVVPSSSECIVTWKLNGVDLAGNDVFRSFLSSDLNAGVNTLRATISNGVSSAVRDWTVNKNRPPLCSPLAPALAGNLINYNQTLAMSANGSDGDGDPITFLWKFDGVVNNALFVGTLTNASSTSTTLTPGLPQVGANHTISANVSDGLDSSACSWIVSIQDPNTVTVSSCLPSGDPITIYSAGAQSSKTFTVGAVGTALTYKWFKNGSEIAGETSPFITLGASDFTVNNHTLQTQVKDTYNNLAYCNWNIKRNGPPTINTFTPNNASTIRLSNSSTLPFTVNATDPNGDTMTYSWTLDGYPSGTLASGFATSTFNPGSNNVLLGGHSVKVVVSDGVESVEKSWNIESNLFSQTCNDIYNGSVSTKGGYLCTLIGSPSIGDTLDPASDQTKIKMTPAYVIDDGSGNHFVSDQTSHVIAFYNRSAANITRFGITIPAGKMKVILGNGANGKNDDGINTTEFKLNTPRGLAYDSTNERLYVADYSNHRVVMLNSAGIATTIFGNGTTTQNSTTNADDAIGTNLTCTNPNDVRLIDQAPDHKWLYIACYGGGNYGVIKKMEANPARADYGKGWTAVGRLNASYQNANANIDGSSGSTGDAYVNGPWALSDDGLGNLYWSEYGSYRVRMLATSGNTVSFFPNRTISSSMTIYATDMSAVPLTQANNTIQALSGLAPATALNIYGANINQQGSCYAYRIRVMNASAQATTVAANTSVTLSAGNGNFYTNSTCTSATTTTVQIAAGNSEAEIFYKSANLGAVTLTAQFAGLTNGTLAVTVANSVAAPTKLALFTPANFYYNTCQPLIIQAQSAANQAAINTVARTIRLSHTSTGNFYDNSSCSGAPITNIVLANGAREVTAYYARTTIANPNETVTLFGNAATNGISTSETPSGAFTLRTPVGLAVHTVGGAVKGFFVSGYDNDRIAYLNNDTSSITFGGTTVGAQNGAIVMGSGTRGFNGDDIIGNTVRIAYPYGLSLNSTNNQLLVADSSNNRTRALDLSINNGLVTTLLGQGRTRSGFQSDSPQAAPLGLLNSPAQILLDNTNRIMYISDTANGRIRRVDMLKGYFDTIVGKGVGDASSENEDPTNVYMRGPRAMALINSGGNDFLTYADQQSNTAANSTCLVRAYNMSSNNFNFFGVNVFAGKVASILGDFFQGCNIWSTAPANVDGALGTSMHLYNPEGIAASGTNLYVANYNDHCILKMNSAGNVTQLVGACGTTGNTDGSTTVARIRLPTAIAIDPYYPADGNFFFADQTDQGSAKIRYVNFKANPPTLNIGGVSVSAATAPNGNVKTLWNVIGGYIYSIAAFENQICYAGGRVNDGNSGPHNITCRDRDSLLGTITLRVGRDENTADTTKAGAPLHLEQENIAASQALVSSPYGLAFDSEGNLYFSERNNHIVRMIRRWW